MVTPENLYQVLMALKDAGVVRARFGDVELQFAPEVTPPDAPAQYQAPTTISVVTSAPQTADSAQSEPHRPGYSQLFPRPPRFEPA